MAGRVVKPGPPRAFGPGRSHCFSEILGDNDPVNDSVAQLTDRLMRSYEQAGGINHLDGVNLPSKSAVAAITLDLLQLLFPGFFSERPIPLREIRGVTAKRMAIVWHRLADEMSKSLEYSPPAGMSTGESSARAGRLAHEFLDKLTRIRELLQTDVEAAFEGDPAALSREEVIVAYPGLEAIAVQRMAHELYVERVALIPRMMTEWAHARTGIDLHPGARIGTHFFIDHGTGTVVGETARIGHHVKMYQGVGLVARSLAGGQQLRGQKRHPTLQDHVTIYAGATIVGGDTVIGEGSTIGGNVFLMHSVPPHSLVLYEADDVKIVPKAGRFARGLDYEI